MSVGHPGRRPSTPVVAVERLPENELPWGYLQWLYSGVLFGDAQQTFGYVELNPGAQNARHFHPNSDEVLFLLEGEIAHSLGEGRYRLTAGMAIHILHGRANHAINTGTTIAWMVVAFPTADRQVVLCDEGEERR